MHYHRSSVITDFSSHTRIFAYSIHSILYPYSTSGDTWGNLSKADDVFSICICDSDMPKVKMIANLFCNFLLVNKEKPSAIPADARISCSSLRNKKINYVKYSCMPMIITHKKEIIIKSLAYVNYCQKNRELGKINYFPVFLSKRAMNTDEIIDFSTKDIIPSFSFAETKLLLDALYLHFILYLAECSESGNTTLQKLYHTMTNWCMKQTDFDYDCHRYEAMLWIAIAGFCYFLRDKLHCSDEANELERRAKLLFFQQKSISYTSKIALDRTLLALDSYITYCLDEIPEQHICSIQKELKTGVLCYYLDYKKFMSSYPKYLKIKQLAPISPRELLKVLKQQELLILRSNRAQYAIKRTVFMNESKCKIDVIAINRTLFDKKVADIEK